MTANPIAAPVATRMRTAGGGRLSPAKLGLFALGLLLLLSIVRILTGADDLTSSGTIAAALGLAVPIGLAALGGLWSERSGVVNIGLEGMLILGTWGGGYGGWKWGPWAGVALGILMGALGGLLHAVATVTFGVDHIVSGVAIILLGGGVAQYLSSIAFVGVPGGGTTQSPPVEDIQTVTVPVLSDALGDVEGAEVAIVSDFAGVLRGLVTDMSLLTILAIAMVFASYVILWRTAFGLRLRACGESPAAAESLGVNVYTMKYAAVVVSGALAGMGGAFLAIVAASAYREGQTGGRGFIGLAAMIFGNWRPGGLAAGAGLFGYTDALQLRRGGESVHALLLLVALLLVGLAALSLRRKAIRAAAISGIGGVLVLIWFLQTDEVPENFTTFTPHVATLLVLALASQRLRMPAADGQPYRRGQT